LSLLHNEGVSASVLFSGVPFRYLISRDEDSAILVVDQDEVIHIMPLIGVKVPFDPVLFRVSNPA
jgi:hypothetical protein